MTLGYTLSYAGVPFVLDVSKIVRMHLQKREGTTEEYLPPNKYQPKPNLMEKIEELLPWDLLNDFVGPGEYPGRNLDAIAWQHKLGPSPTSQDVKVGNYYYPTNASRWSVFRGLATSAMVKQMVAAAYSGGTNPQPFVMQSVPHGTPEGSSGSYTVSTNMYMLPPRCIAETAGNLPGLYLVTLVDERYYWQWKPISGFLTKDLTWLQVINACATKLGIVVNIPGGISPVYQQPDTDSQFWVNRENAAMLMDAACWNISRTFVRKLNGTYNLESNDTSLAIINANRPSAAAEVRFAGGDMFVSDNLLPVGSLASAKQAVLPASVDVTFPKYVEGDNPVPHMFNSRYTNQRPSCWYEESYGDVYVKNIPLGAVAGYGGLNGIGTHAIHSTAKALFFSEESVLPTNQVGLDALAMQLAADYLAGQSFTALDEVYPGTYAWTPEGFNDIIWTYSGDKRQASTRVQRCEWNQIVRELQHSTPVVNPNISTNTVRGVGGPTVPQTWRDQHILGSGYVQNVLTTSLGINDKTAVLTNVDYFPTQNRWRGMVEQEAILFEGTSGAAFGMPGNLLVDIVYRGIDGTVAKNHVGGNSVIHTRPNTAYGVNLVTAGPGFFMHQGAWTSGGICEAILLAPCRTVRVIDASGTLINGYRHHSGYVANFSALAGDWIPAELVWIIERNRQLPAPINYAGQLVDYSAKNPPTIDASGNVTGLGGTTAPVYAINVLPGLSSGTCVTGSGITILASGTGSGSVCSGVSGYVPTSYSTQIVTDVTCPSGGPLTVTKGSLIITGLPGGNVVVQ